MHLKLAAVVVTYNRKALLQRCLNALLTQTAPLDRIFVVDNASTDSTDELFASDAYRNNPRIEYQRLPDNVGGAGGFANGMQRAYEWGADHVWIMDDDATPEAGALAALMKHIGPNVVPVSTQLDRYGHLYGAYHRVAPGSVEIPLSSGFDVVESMAFMFVGPLFSRASIEHNGLPRKDFFISFDDIEYSLRLRKNGFRIVLVERSKIRHEYGGVLARKRILWMVRRRPMYPGWRYYYDARNRVAVAKEYSRVRVLAVLLEVAVMFRQMVADVLFNPREAASRAGYRLRGIVDGMSDRLGKRVDPR